MTHEHLVTSTELRRRFAERLSTLYGREVPLYLTLLEESQRVNAAVLQQRGEAAERLGTLHRVTAERHGAIRLGTPWELAQAARIFKALGMYPCGFYDLRDARPSPIPVVSTAFRPIERSELAANPFRVFTSLLVPEDRRFFSTDLQNRLTNFLASRQLFPDELLSLSDEAVREGGLRSTRALRFLDLATSAFELSTQPVDRAWYEELERISSVAADIGGVASTHINHLTPRVLDIDALYANMRQRGVEMIDAIQGPPAWDGPDLLLRQTSFRALEEPRVFREADGTLVNGSLRVRFGEVEARGIAPTQRGREMYERLVREVDRRMDACPHAERREVAVDVWRAGVPRSESELRKQDLAHFTYELVVDPASRLEDGQRAALRSGELDRLLETGVLVAQPIVYEDFLPRSAAGIFASNLAGGGLVDVARGGAARDAGWLSDVVGRQIFEPESLYREESARSCADAARLLGIELTARWEP